MKLVNSTFFQETPIKSEQTIISSQPSPEEILFENWLKDKRIQLITFLIHKKTFENQVQKHLEKAKDITFELEKIHKIETKIDKLKDVIKATKETYEKKFNNLFVFDYEIFKDYNIQALKKLLPSQLTLWQQEEDFAISLMNNRKNDLKT